MYRNFSKGIFCITALMTICNIVSCTSKEDKKRVEQENKLRTFFALNLTDTTAKVDSFEIVKIDTITQKMVLVERQKMIGNEFEDLAELVQLQLDLMKTYSRQVRLYRSVGLNDDAGEKKEDLDKKSKETDSNIKKLNELHQRRDSVIKLIQTSDSIKPVAYEARCFYQLRNKDQSVKRDTAYIILNINKDPVRRNDFFEEF